VALPRSDLGQCQKLNVHHGCMLPFGCQCQQLESGALWAAVLPGYPAGAVELTAGCLSHSSRCRSCLRVALIVANICLHVYYVWHR